MRVVGVGGVGGLTTPERLAAFGHRAALRSARRRLASGVDAAGGLSFDGGLYHSRSTGPRVAFERLGIDVAELGLEPMHQLCE